MRKKNLGINTVTFLHNPVIFVFYLPLGGRQHQEPRGPAGVQVLAVHWGEVIEMMILYFNICVIL